MGWARFGGGLLVWYVVPRGRCPGPPGSCSPVCALCVWCLVCGVLGRLAPVHPRARSVCGVACTVSWASWLLFTGVHALCVVSRVRCGGPPGSCSPVCTLCVWCCVIGVLGRLAPVHRCARSVCGVACTVSWASWLLVTGVHALCLVLRVRCPGPLGSCSPLGALCVWCCAYSVLGVLAPVQRCARSVCGVVYAVSLASWLLFTRVHALCVVLCVRCPGPPGSCSPVCPLCVWCCGCGVLARLAPVHRCARPVRGVVCAVSWAAWLLFTGVPALVCCVMCTVAWAPWLRFTGVHTLCAVLCVRRPRPLGSCSSVRVLVVSCRLCCVLRFLAPVLRRARSVCGVVCVVSWAFWPLFAGVLVWWVLFCVCGVLGHLIRVLRCCGVLRCVWCSVCGVACAVSWASWPLFIGAHAWCVVLCGRCPRPLESCSPVCLCGVLCGVSGGLGFVAPVHRCARSVCGVLGLVSWASWLPFTGVPVLCVAFCGRCPGPLGSRSPLCLRGVCCVACLVSWAPWLVFTGVLCACSVCCVLCAVSWATWLLFTGVRARCVPWCVRCGCWCVSSSSLHFSSRSRVGAVWVLLLGSCVHSCHMVPALRTLCFCLHMAQTPWGTLQRTRHWQSGQQGVQPPMVSYLLFPSWNLFFRRRPRISVSQCMHGGVCYSLVGLWTICILRRPRVGVFA